MLPIFRFVFNNLTAFYAKSLKMELNVRVPLCKRSVFAPSTLSIDIHI